MKARPVKTAPEAMIAYKQDKNMAILEKTASSLGITLIVPEKHQAGESIGYLAGYAGSSSNGSKDEAADGCLIFAGISGKKLDSVLSKLREAGADIPYKAVVTAANQSWSIKKLLPELIKERKQLGK